ncbi:MAG: hypothetical protein WBC83_01465 [Minisyncoccia bacterium]
MSGTFLCEECVTTFKNARRPEYVFITAIFDYQNPVMRKVIWRFKYRNARDIAMYFGKQLYEEILNELGDELDASIRPLGTNSFLLVPIPLHKKRLRERGYNQSELLASEIIKHDIGKILQVETRALKRMQNTKPQAKSEKRASRFKNLCGAFTATPSIVRGKHIILIDDVTTTGATFSEARKTLLRAGARSVRAYAIAH